MPYSDYAVADRKAVAQLRYQARRFIRQMAECDTEQCDIERISQALMSAVSEAAGSIDYHDDGSRMEAADAPA